MIVELGIQVCESLPEERGIARDLAWLSAELEFESRWRLGCDELKDRALCVRILKGRKSRECI